MENHTPKHALELEKRIIALELQVSQLPKKEDIAEVVKDALLETLKSTGKITKTAIITTAVVLGAFAVIGGALKWLLGVIGFHYLMK